MHKFIPFRTDPNTPPEYVADTSSFDYFGSMIWVIIVLIFIIGGIVLLVKFLGQKSGSWMKHRAIRVLGGAVLGQNKSVQVVEIGRQIYILGIGDDVRILDKINKAEETDEFIRAFESEQAARNAPWADWIQERFYNRRNQEKQQAEELAVTFRDMMEQKMSRLSDRNQLVKEILNENNKTDRSMDK